MKKKETIGYISARRLHDYLEHPFKVEQDMDVMYIILEKEKPNQREVIRIKALAINKYFPKEYTPKQIVELIEKLVKEWSGKSEMDFVR